MQEGLSDQIGTNSLKDTYIENIYWAAQQCEKNDLVLLIEAISDETIPRFFMNHPDFAVNVLQEVNLPSAKLLFDTYHAKIKGLNPLDFLKENFEMIAHIQIADFPGRHEPGSGEIDFNAFFEYLISSNYSGWLGCEYKPEGKTTDGLVWQRCLLAELKNA